MWQSQGCNPFRDSTYITYVLVRSRYEYTIVNNAFQVSLVLLLTSTMRRYHWHLSVHNMYIVTVNELHNEQMDVTGHLQCISSFSSLDLQTSISMTKPDYTSPVISELSTCLLKSR